MSPVRIDPSLAGLRRELSGLRGESFWQRLEELGDRPELRDFLEREFPSQAERFRTTLPRRDFLRLMGASLGVAGLGACTRQPDERIVPYAKSPEERIPGRPQHYATTMTLAGSVLGLVVESHEGRPTKIEGNTEHPASLGSTDLLAQAAVLSLYDPDRSQTVLRAGQIATWDEFYRELRARIEGLDAIHGEGLCLLTEEIVSPTLGEQIDALLQRYSRARWYRWQAVNRDFEREGARLAFGRDVTTRLRLDRARVIASLDADFLASGNGGVRHARDFARARRTVARGDRPNRLYVIESSVSATGSIADHRLGVRPSEVEHVARALARELGLDVAADSLAPERAALVRALAADLRANEGQSLLVAGTSQPPAVHALVHALNEVLGNAGRTVDYGEPSVHRPTSVTDSLSTFVDEARAGNVQTLLVLGGNPVHDAPADHDVADALGRVPFRVHHSLYEDETSELCHWHVPAAHFLETWSDARAFDGTLSPVQPLIAPLYGGRTAHEMVAALAGEPGKKPYDIVREHWRRRGDPETTEAGFERAWARALHDGLVRGSARPPLDVRARRDPAVGPPPQSTTGVEIAFRPDPNVFDGRFANNGWLQETPRPWTRLVWDNAALVGTRTADALSLESGQVVRLGIGGRSIEAPVWITAGHPEQCVTLHLGYGRRLAGRLGRGVGFDAYPLRTSRSPWHAAGVQLEPTRRRHELVSVQDHSVMEGRDLVRVVTADRFAKGESHAAEHGDASLYPSWPYEGHAWGMVIDLTACIGCNACMVACQSENNVPVVGKEEVSRGREMHWLRIDRYFEGEGDEALVLHQPVPCMHCENAPCELVCPVGATVHGPEGLNQMVYNRCVGTRYCSNNCPYKVRRFNFFGHVDRDTESLKLGKNPDVTIRTRGVMEKCTYCIQRINERRIQERKDGQPIADGEIQAACQQACPTQVIAFGDLNDRESEVARLRRSPHHYELLGELGTKPRTTYLSRVRNPNPELGQG